MKTVANLKEAILALGDKVVAITQLATEEKRDLTTDEKTEIDAINGVEGKPGQIDNLQVELERAVKIESRLADIAAIRGGKKIKNIGNDGSPKPTIKIPARAKVHGELRAFKGRNADRNAFVAGQFLAGHILGNEKSKRWLKDHGIKIRNSLSTDANEGAGIFVPNEMSLSIIRLVEEFGIARKYCKISPMSSSTKTQPVRVAGMKASPVSETKKANEGSNTGTQSQPGYTNVELVARKWKTWVKMSDEITEDIAIMIADEVAVECAQAFSEAEDDALFNGDGTSAFHGITGVMAAILAGSVHTALAGNTAFSTLDIDDFRTMKGKLPRYPGMRPAWFISPEGYADSMERLQLAVNGTTPRDVADGGLPRFLGYPVVESNSLNSILTAQASTNLVVLGDLRMGTLFGDRRQMTLSATDQRYWDEDQVAIKATERFDINVHSKGTATKAGAIMVLQTPAA
jgi:HK97 family phage major capsid protein